MIIATGAVPVTPDDNKDQFYVSLYVGGGGDVTVTTQRGNKVTFKSVVAGTFLSVQVRRVWATGTTATDLLGLV